MKQKVHDAQRILVAGLFILLLCACSGGSGQTGSTAAPLPWTERLNTVEITYFGDPLIEDDGLQVTVASPAKPAGLFFRKTVAIESVYRVTVSGETESGYAVLRITFDDDRPIYVNLAYTDGDFTFEFSDIGRIELLLYSDEAYRYRLFHLSIDRCESCEHSSRSDARLKTRILAEHPGLENTVREDPLRAAEILTDWVAQVLDHGDPEGPVIDNTFLIEVSPPGWIQDHLWDTDAGGTYCQGFATYLDKVLRLFGIPSFVFTMGFDGTYLTHVTTVVVTNDASGRRYFMFDPTFNGSFVDAAGGGWVHLETLLERYGASGMDGLGVTFQTRPISRTKFVSESGMELFMVYLSESGEVANCPENANEEGFFVCRDFSAGVPFYRASKREDLQRMNVDPERIMESLLLQGGVLSTNWGDTPEDIDDFHALLDRYNVPRSHLASHHHVSLETMN